MSTKIPVELVWCEFHNPRPARVTDKDAHLETPECVYPFLSGVFSNGRTREAGQPSMTAVETLDPRLAVTR
ncbi:hypothetical protein [Occultella kanbiaonis]|uniref:hypothetical protein n=1 Tax=Occultella kanbiaonis TaxID=2675754 RepID=UPI0013D5A1AA|nr:hypothetical protein [Occultella kanbiaonis]